MDPKRIKAASDRLMTYQNTHAVRLEDFDYASDAVIHLTICSVHSTVFTDRAIATMVCDSIVFCSNKLNYELYGYCVMPDHVHVLLSPSQSRTPIARWLQRFKSYTTNRFRRYGGCSKLWQRSAYDHVCRESETTSKVLSYIVDNPVRAGLVDDWKDWPWTGIFIQM